MQRADVPKECTGDERARWMASAQRRYLTANPTGYFGTLTQSAVQAFQCTESIVCSGSPDTTGFGAVGPRTRGRMNGN